MMIKPTVMVALLSAALVSLALVFISGASGQGCPRDDDADGICDVPTHLSDNCTALFNPGQRDDDEDGYGNICDPDVTQDCAIGAPDISSTFATGLSFPFPPWVPPSLGAYDVDENNAINTADINIIYSRSYETPGPSSRTCADCTATPAAGLGLGVCP